MTLKKNSGILDIAWEVIYNISNILKLPKPLFLDAEGVTLTTLGKLIVKMRTNINYYLPHS